MGTPNADANALIDDIAAQEKNLDEIMRRAPNTLSDDEFRSVIEIQRKLRAAAMFKEAAKKAKKEGIEDE